MYFVQLFPCMFVGFNVRVECESLVKNCENSEVRDWLVSGQLAKGHVRSTCWNLNSLLPGCISRVTSQLRASRKWSMKLSTWNFLKCIFLFFYQHYISPHYPRNCKETFREKTLTIHLKVRDCKPTIIYTIFFSFSLLLPLQFQILEMFLTQTLTSPNLSVERSFGACGKHWNKSSIGGCNLELIAWFG